MTPTAAPDSTAIMMLCAPLSVGDGDAPPLSPGEWAKLAAAIAASDVGRPAALVGLSAEEIAKRVGVDPALGQRIESLLQRGGPLAFELERLESRGAWLMTRADDDYPGRLRQRLGLKAPAVLFGAGPRATLSTGGVAMVGSRDASDEALEFARAFAGRLAGEGTTVISGAARGIDRTAMGAALEAGGLAVGVLADDLTRMMQQTQTRSLIEEGQLTLVTPYAPTARFTPGNAMARNKLVYCLADAAVVVATSSGKGGTWIGALENLKAQWVPLWVWRDDGAGPANRELVDAGALALLSAGMPAGGLQAWLSGPFERPQDLEGETQDLFDHVWPLLAAFLASPRKEGDVAERFGLQRSQARSWLQRAVELGLVTRNTRPVSYRISPASEPISQPSLFEDGP